MMAQPHILEEWRIRDIEQKAERASSRLFELASLRGDVDSMEHTNRELRSRIDELRSTIEVYREEVQQLQEQITNVREELISSKPGDPGPIQKSMETI